MCHVYEIAYKIAPADQGRTVGEWMPRLAYVFLGSPFFPNLAVKRTMNSLSFILQH